MQNDKLIIILWIINIFIFLTDVFTIIFVVWTSTLIEILFFIYFCFSCIYFIYLTYIIFGCSICHNIYLFNKLINLFGIFLLLSLVFWLYEIILLYINSAKFTEYWRNCPYLFTDIDYKSNIGRRCILYYFNSNSRYSYQYLCSFDSSKEFETKIRSKEIKPNNVICIMAKNIFEYNESINQFLNIYQNKIKYYCSRTNIPKIYSFDKNNKSCKKIKNIFIMVSYVLIYIRIIYFCFLPKIIKKMLINNNNNIERRLFNHIIIFSLSNNLNRSNNSTKITENNNNQSRNEDFVRQNTKNIVVENKQEFSVEADINNLGNDNKKIKANEIRLSFNNHEENKLKINNDRSNINIINNNL